MTTDGKSSGSTPSSLKPVSGVNSKVAEALSEYSDHIMHIDEIEDYIKQVEPTVLPLFYKLRDEMKITKVQEMISALIQEEINQGMLNRDTICEYLRNDKAVVLLPLPPHIIDYLASSMKKGFVYNTEEKEPAHLAVIDGKYEYLSLDNLSDVIKVTKNVETVVCDGQRLNGSVLVRPVTATLMEALLNKKVRTLYIHKIPHLPKGQKFTKIDLSDYELEVREI